MYSTNVSFRALLAAILLIWSAITHAAAPMPTQWKYDGESDGIKLYTRTVPGQEFKDFRGIMTVDAPIMQVSAAIADIDTHDKWVFLLKKAAYMDQRSLDDCYVYLDIKGIWPVSPRDAVIHVKVSQNPATLAITVNVRAVPNHIGKLKSHVRIPSMNSGWKLTPVSPTRTEIELIGNADPGGWIPTSIANMVVTVMPKETLKGLRKFLKNPDYADLSIAFARNPRLAELASRLKTP